jgi:hydroxyethylthiazole kinase-like uncharacterized protein yjeF
MRQSPRAKPSIITDALLRRWALTEPESAGSKEARGRVVIIAGAAEMPGAAILASTAALRSGAGKARLAIGEAAALHVGAAVPELFVLSIADGKRRGETLRGVVDSAEKADAVLIGPGMRDTDAVEALLPKLLEIETLPALVIDATALLPAIPLIRSASKLRGKMIITPHGGEMDAISGGEKDREEYARTFAAEFGTVVALKGAETLICAPDGAAYLNKRGNVGLATAGSGDVLAGIVAGLCARGIDPVQAVVWAVSVHARAGERLARRLGAIGYLAREILDEIPSLTSGRF